MQHGGTFRDVTCGGALVEPAVTMRTLNVVGILGRRGWGQVGQFAAACQMSLHFLGRPDCSDKLLVLLPPVALFGVRLHHDTGNCLVRGRHTHRPTFLRHVTLGVRALQGRI